MNIFIHENGLLPAEASAEIKSGKGKGNIGISEGTGKIMQTMEYCLHGVLLKNTHILQTGSSVNKPVLPDASIFI